MSSVQENKYVRQLAKIAAYSFAPINWDWNILTPAEKDIIKSPGVFAELRAFVHDVHEEELAFGNQNT